MPFQTIVSKSSPHQIISPSGKGEDRGSSGGGGGGEAGEDGQDSTVAIVAMIIFIASGGDGGYGGNGSHGNQTRNVSQGGPGGRGGNNPVAPSTFNWRVSSIYTNLAPAQLGETGKSGTVVGEREFINNTGSDITLTIVVGSKGRGGISGKGGTITAIDGANGADGVNDGSIRIRTSIGPFS